MVCSKPLKCPMVSWKPLKLSMISSNQCNSQCSLKRMGLSCGHNYYSQSWWCSFVLKSNLPLPVGPWYSLPGIAVANQTLLITQGKWFESLILPLFSFLEKSMLGSLYSVVLYATYIVRFQWMVVLQMLMLWICILSRIDFTHFLVQLYMQTLVIL